MIHFAGPSLAFVLASKDAAQPPSHIAVDCFKDVGRAMLEVLIPSFQCQIQIRADGFDTSAIVASGLAPYCVFEFV